MNILNRACVLAVSKTDKSLEEQGKASKGVKQRTEVKMPIHAHAHTRGISSHRVFMCSVGFCNREMAGVEKQLKGMEGPRTPHTLPLGSRQPHFL